MEIFWLIAGWIVYFFVHSLLATRQIKGFARSHGVSSQMYRLIYNVIAFISLIPIFFISGNIQAGFVLEPNKILKFSGLILAGYGIVLVKMAFKSYDTRAFLGLAPFREEEFKTDGLLKHVRHPVYSASILILMGYFLFDPKWNVLISVTMLILYFVIGSQFEERKLIDEFGDKYVEYKKRTPMLVPRLWKRS
jgi:protein-S-isoprenylcysteine O-methyltransferase Ste14